MAQRVCVDAEQSADYWRQNQHNSLTSRAFTVVLPQGAVDYFTTQLFDVGKMNLKQCLKKN